MLEYLFLKECDKLLSEVIEKRQGDSVFSVWKFIAANKLLTLLGFIQKQYCMSSAMEKLIALSNYFQESPGLLRNH